MKRILEEIRSGKFANEWIDENKSGAGNFKALRGQDHEHPVEQVGKELRRLMPWIDSKEV